MSENMWDKEPLIPSTTQRNKTLLSPVSKKQINIKNVLHQIINPLVPSPRHGPFSVIELIMPMFTYMSLIMLFHNFRSPHSSLSAATLSVSLYVIIVPLVTYILCYLSNANLSYLKILSLVTSSLFGDLLALLVPLLLSHEVSLHSHGPFLASMTVFGGLATARVVMVLVVALPIPVMRLLIGTTLAITNLLFLLYLHFGFMHPTFKYGVGAYKTVY